MESQPVLSVVVPVLNGARTLPALLDALAAQTLGEPWEVIFGDGGSSDGSRELLAAARKRLPARVSVVEDPGRPAALSRQRPLCAARAPLVAFTDADCRPEPTWLVAGLHALRQADLVQGRVIPDGPAGPFDRSLSVTSEYGLYETANLFVRRELANRAGGFLPVPGLEVPGRGAFGEDVWFAWRCRRAGGRSAFAPDAVVRHEVRPRSATGFVRERTRARLFPPLVACVPELRNAFLHRRWFLSPTSLRFDLALAGLTLAAAATHRRRPLWHGLAAGAPATVAVAVAVAALPYLGDVLADSRGRPPGTRAWFAATRPVADAVSCAALLRGSLAARCLVI